ncbi:hypothetical protein pb186bvf_000960 [Paramecium bursaria]
MSSQNLELQEQMSLTNSLLSDRSSGSDLVRSSFKQMKEQKQLKLIEEMAEKKQVDEKQNEINKVIQSYEQFWSQGIKKHKWENFLPLILPNSYAYVLWKLCVALTIIFIFFEIPVYITYGVQFWQELLDPGQMDGLFYSLEAILLVDMALEFVTAYYKHGNLVTNSLKIAKHYLYGYFIFDSFAIFISILRLSLMTEKFKWIYMVFYFKYPSLLRIDDIIAQKILLHRALRTIYQVAKMMVYMLFYFQIACCIFYEIGQWAVSMKMNSWLTTSGNFDVIIDKPLHQIYFFGYYYALCTVSTTMGYGDITPMNIYECSFALMEIMFAIMVFANNINKFQNLMEEYYAYDMRVFKHQICISKFMMIKNVPPELQERVRQYLNQYWYEQGTRDVIMEEQIFLQLAPELRQELTYFSYGQFFVNQFFSKHFSRPFLLELSLRIKEVSYAQGETLIYDKANEYLDDYGYYYLVSGHIQINPGNSEYVSHKCQGGDSFGEWSFLTGFPRTATAEAKQYSCLHKLKRQDLLEVLDRFPHDYENYCMIRDELMFYKNIGFIGLKCYTCGNQDHYANDCPITHHKPPAQILVQNDTVLDKLQQRLHIDRFARKQWPTRINSHILIKGLNNNKLKKKVSMMLKTQRALFSLQTEKKTNLTSIKEEIESEKKEVSAISSIKRTESNDNISLLDSNAKQSFDDNPMNEESPPQNLMKQTQFNPFYRQQSNIEDVFQVNKSDSVPQNGQNGTSEKPKSKKLEEYQKVSQPYIHKGLDKFDVPANFKYYYKQQNSSNYEVFKNIALEQQEQFKK